MSAISSEGGRERRDEGKKASVGLTSPELGWAGQREGRGLLSAAPPPLAQPPRGKRRGEGRPGRHRRHRLLLLLLPFVSFAPAAEAAAVRQRCGESAGGGAEGGLSYAWRPKAAAAAPSEVPRGEAKAHQKPL